MINNIELPLTMKVLGKTLMVFAMLVSILMVFSPAATAKQDQAYDYFSANRDMIRNGVQSVLTCNGLFTSNRDLKQVFAQELAFLKNPVGTAEGGNYQVDYSKKWVAVGGEKDGTRVMAAFREGIGCVVLGPKQGPDDIDLLPTLEIAGRNLDYSKVPWPNGDLLPESRESKEFDSTALEAASQWAFNRESDEQDTLSLLVVHQGKIVHERYAPGIDMTTRTRTWSTAKSIAASVIGNLVDQGKMNLDSPLGFEWLPKFSSSISGDLKDPRNKITLRHLLQMSSGLYPVDSFGMEYAIGSGLAYWAGASSVTGALKRGLTREPGTFWEYENYDTLLAVYAMKRVLGDQQKYLNFPYTQLLSKIGMNNTLISTDRFGDFIFSSQVYTNARDLARFGLLYLQNGVWEGEQLISKEWIEFVRTPAPATKLRGQFYGAQWWLVPDDRLDVPKDSFATAGNRGQYVIVVPSHDVVIVRRGLDFGKQGFDRWDLTREVLKAFTPMNTKASDG